MVAVQAGGADDAVDGTVLLVSVFATMADSRYEHFIANIPVENNIAVAPKFDDELS